MKKLSYILIIAIITVIGCTTETLKDKTVIELIRKEYHYPRIIDYDIYCSDPEDAQKVLKSGLEEKGMVTVKRTQNLKDIGSPLIYFTDAAKPYFLITSEDDKKSDIQKVKIADEEFGKIEDIKIWNSGKMAIVTFSSVRKNTIFGELLRKASPIIKQHKAYFLLTQNGWQMMDQSDVDLLLLNY